ncbi:MAG: NAD(P)H-dependent oxidoreductase [Candidatus Hydrogenedentes bacterium]|nr:NAD(P)H-dependent oxidoreductase [Candidatus Hydrogenedentota bacterium]
MSFLTISSSLHPDSRSSVLARAAFQRFQILGVDAEYVDLRDLALPLCDGADCYKHPAVLKLTEQIQSAKGVLLAVPIYNYGAGATARNLIELTGDAWRGKVVGFACAAAGDGSYMAVMALANSLMLNFRTVIVPRFVYTDSEAFDGDAIANPKIQKRMDELTETLVRFASALQGII